MAGGREEPAYRVTPIELREHELPVQAALGFHRGRTEELLERAAATLERLNVEVVELRAAKAAWERERAQLEGELAEASARAERVLGQVMVEAHTAAQRLREQTDADLEEVRAELEQTRAQAEAEREHLLAKAQLEAQELVAEAEARSGQLAAQAEQYRLLAEEVRRRSVRMLRSALDALGEGPAEHKEDSAPSATPFRRADAG